MAPSEQPPAASTIQIAGHAASDVINGLKGSPALLAIVVLNLLAIGAGAWFMVKVVDASQKNMTAILQSCFHKEQL
jgi:hypothetical protein